MTELAKQYIELDTEYHRLQRLWDAGKLKTTADVGKFQFIKFARSEVLNQLMTQTQRRSA